MLHVGDHGSIVIEQSALDVPRLLSDVCPLLSIEGRTDGRQLKAAQVYLRWLGWAGSAPRPAAPHTPALTETGAAVSAARRT